MELIEKGESHDSISKKFNVALSTIGKIKKRKECYQDLDIETRKKKKINSFQSSLHAELDSRVNHYFNVCRSYNLTVTGEMLQEAAKKTATDLKIENFNASRGWLDKFKQRHLISMRNLCGESNSVNKETVDNWKAHIEDKIRGYSLDNIFNCDETGLLFRMQCRQFLHRQIKIAFVLADLIIVMNPWQHQQ